jgi:Ras-related protein Rab-5C/Rab family protein
VIALVGNKLDLVEEEQKDEPASRQVSYEEASAYASEAGLLFFETSAKKSTNVDSVFIEIGIYIYMIDLVYSYSSFSQTYSS